MTSDLKTKYDQINQIRKSQSRERDKFDKILLTMSAGTLSLSATFISQSSAAFFGENYLFVSWILLLVGLFSILFAYIFAELYFKYFEAGVRDDRFESFEDAENNWRNKLVNLFNWVSFITIVMGISVFVYFVYLNIKTRDTFEILNIKNTVQEEVVPLKISNQDNIDPAIKIEICNAQAKNYADNIAKRDYLLAFEKAQAAGQTEAAKIYFQFSLKPGHPADYDNNYQSEYMKCLGN